MDDTDPVMLGIRINYDMPVVFGIQEDLEPCDSKSHDFGI